MRDFAIYITKLINHLSGLKITSDFTINNLQDYFVSYSTTFFLLLTLYEVSTWFGYMIAMAN